MSKGNQLLIVIIAIIAIILFSLVYFSDNKQTDETVERYLSIFSWSSKEVTDNQSQFVTDMVEFQFDRVFQSFSSKLSMEEATSFVKALDRKNIAVYGLSGTPEWASDASGEKMIKRLERLIDINHQLPKHINIKGFVINVEPYVLDDFDWENQSLQANFIEGMRHLYDRAIEANMELIVVIPYFYDTKGYKQVATYFIRDYSTEVAVMNYYQNKEIKNLSFEAKIAKEAKVPLTTIYEFKKPGKHGLKEKNTYYSKGLSAVESNAEKLIKHYENQTIHIAYHDYKSFRKVMDRE